MAETDRFGPSVASFLPRQNGMAELTGKPKCSVCSRVLRAPIFPFPGIFWLSQGFPDGVLAVDHSGT